MPLNNNTAVEAAASGQGTARNEVAMTVSRGSCPEAPLSDFRRCVRITSSATPDCRITKCRWIAVCKIESGSFSLESPSNAQHFPSPFQESLWVWSGDRLRMGGRVVYCVGLENRSGPRSPCVRIAPHPPFCMMLHETNHGETNGNH